MAGEVESQRDGSSAGLMALGDRAVGRGVGFVVEGVEEPFQGVLFSTARGEPYVVLGHGMAVSLLELCCGQVDKVGGFAELALQDVPVGVVGDEY